MHSRLKTDFDLKEKKLVPGPGSYKLTAMEVGNKGHYPLSNMKQNIFNLETQVHHDTIAWVLLTSKSPVLA